jgi:hypothetical protein
VLARCVEAAKRAIDESFAFAQHSALFAELVLQAENVTDAEKAAASKLCRDLDRIFIGLPPKPTAAQSSVEALNDALGVIWIIDHLARSAATQRKQEQAKHKPAILWVGSHAELRLTMRCPETVWGFGPQISRRISYTDDLSLSEWLHTPHEWLTYSQRQACLHIIRSGMDLAIHSFFDEGKAAAVMLAAEEAEATNASASHTPSADMDDAPDHEDVAAGTEPASDADAMTDTDLAADTESAPDTDAETDTDVTADTQTTIATETDTDTRAAEAERQDTVPPHHDAAACVADAPQGLPAEEVLSNCFLVDCSMAEGLRQWLVDNAEAWPAADGDWLSQETMLRCMSDAGFCCAAAQRRIHALPSVSNAAHPWAAIPPGIACTTTGLRSDWLNSFTGQLTDMLQPPSSGYAGADGEELRGLLFSGQPGSGKSTVLRAAAVAAATCCPSVCVVVAGTSSPDTHEPATGAAVESDTSADTAAAPLRALPSQVLDKALETIQPGPGERPVVLIMVDDADTFLGSAETGKAFIDDVAGLLRNDRTDCDVRIVLAATSCLTHSLLVNSSLLPASHPAPSRERVARVASSCPRFASLAASGAFGAIPYTQLGAVRPLPGIQSTDYSQWITEIASQQHRHLHSWRLTMAKAAGNTNWDESVGIAVGSTPASILEALDTEAGSWPSSRTYRAIATAEWASDKVIARFGAMSALLESARDPSHLSRLVAGIRAEVVAQHMAYIAELDAFEGTTVVPEFPASLQSFVIALCKTYSSGENEPIDLNTLLYRGDVQHPADHEPLGDNETTESDQEEDEQDEDLLETEPIEPAAILTEEEEALWSSRLVDWIDQGWLHGDPFKRTVALADASVVYPATFLSLCAPGAMSTAELRELSEPVGDASEHEGHCDTDESGTETSDSEED